MITVNLFSIIILLGLLLITINSQSDYNLFKSYKDSTNKPHHYGKKLRNEHPVEEYLTANQIRMMKHRKGKVTHKDAKFKSNWSGITENKNIRKLDEIVHAVKELTVMNNNISYYSIRWMWLFIIFCSIGWLCYILLNRYQTVRNKSLLPTKTSISNNLEKLTNEN